MANILRNILSKMKFFFKRITNNDRIENPQVLAIYPRGHLNTGQKAYMTQLHFSLMNILGFLKKFILCR